LLASFIVLPNGIANDQRMKKKGEGKITKRTFDVWQMVTYGNFVSIQQKKIV
jgi:hypothetical protein